jgi:hypothetical protein
MQMNHALRRNVEESQKTILLGAILCCSAVGG